MYSIPFSPKNRILQKKESKEPEILYDLKKDQGQTEQGQKEQEGT
jgi:hypothetical protein